MAPASNDAGQWARARLEMMWWRWAHLPSSDAPDLAASMAARIWAWPGPTATTAARDEARSIFLHAKNAGGDDDGRVRRRPQSAAATHAIVAADQ